MPIYTYQNPKTGETKDVVQRMTEEHVYIDETGLKWDRIFSVPQASVDARINPNDQNAFVEKTKKSKDNMGALWDRSRELSEKRAKERGDKGDPLQNKYFDEYAKRRKGRHPNESKFKKYEI